MRPPRRGTQTLRPRDRLVTLLREGVTHTMVTKQLIKHGSWGTGNDQSRKPPCPLRGRKCLPSLLPLRGSPCHPLNKPRWAHVARFVPLHKCTERLGGETKKHPRGMAGTLLQGPRAGLADCANGRQSNIISGQGESPTAQNSRPSQLPQGLKLYH